jgi:hypothetical protein
MTIDPDEKADTTDETESEEQEEEGKPPKSNQRLDKLERENAELRGVSQRSLEEAAAARGQVQLILDQIQRAAATGDAGAQQAQNRVQSMRDKFDEDPVSAMNELVTMRIGPVLQEYFGRSAETEREAAKVKHGKQFDKYEREIDDFMKDMPLDVKAKPGSYTAALKYVRSQHLEDEIEDAKKEERERASRPEGASSAEPDKERPRNLTREEKEVMKAFDMNDDEWDRWSTPGGVKPKAKPKGKAA